MLLREATGGKISIWMMVIGSCFSTCRQQYASDSYSVDTFRTAIIKAYERGACSMKAIGEHFHLHYFLRQQDSECK